MQGYHLCTKNRQTYRPKLGPRKCRGFFGHGQALTDEAGPACCRPTANRILGVELFDGKLGWAT